MEEKRTFKQKVSDWWNNNRRVIKTGATCLFIGFVYGFVKGIKSVTMAALSMESNNTDDEGNLIYDETNVDDPELLELIRLENENS